MPSFVGKAFATYFKNLLGMNQTSNTGVDATLRNVQDGAGNNTSISLSDDEMQVQPVNDDSVRTFSVYNQAGEPFLTADATNKRLMAGENNNNVHTHYAHFGISSVFGHAAVAGTHYAVPFGNLYAGSAVNIAMGTGANPSTTYDISANNNADDMIMYLWYVVDDITIDRVHWFAGGSAATGDNINLHLLSFDIDTDNGSTGGDLSSGTVIAGGSDVTSLGYENIIYQGISPSSADVDGGKVIMATFESNGTNSDYSINITVKYHLR